MIMRWPKGEGVKGTFNKYRDVAKLPAMIFLGMVLVVAGIGKIFYQSEAFTPFPLIETLPIISSIAPALPYIEIVLGMALIHGVVTRPMAVIVGLMSLSFAGYTASMVVTGKGAELCGCFGMVGRITYTDALVVDIMMVLLAVSVYICYRGKYLNYIPWFLESEQQVKPLVEAEA